MIDVNTNYWLYVLPCVYTCIKKGKALLYNTETGMSLEINNDKILTLIKLLYEKKNLGAIHCEGKRLYQAPYQEFIFDFCRKEMGGIVEITQTAQKPIQMLPFLNLQRDIDKHGHNSEEGILNYLHELNIYVNTNCQQSCSFCNDFSQQCLCCRKEINTTRNTMNIRTLKNILSQIKYGTVGRLNILGGNTFNYPYFKEMEELLSDFNGQKNIWNHYTNCLDFKPSLSDFFYNVIITFPLDKKHWNHSLSLFDNVQTKYHFYITNNQEYEEVERLIKKHIINNYFIHPIYTNDETSFFEEHVYIDSDDVFLERHDFRQIFARQKLNTHFFGSLTVLSDGKTYANLNSPSLGNVEQNTLLEIINNELVKNTAWRKVRDSKPCSDCLYQYLCPSPSNYELVIKKNNLCHIIQ